QRIFFERGANVGKHAVGEMGNVETGDLGPEQRMEFTHTKRHGGDYTSLDAKNKAPGANRGPDLLTRRLTAEQLQDRLRPLIGNTQRIYGERLLNLQRRQFRTFRREIGVD